MVQRNLNRKFYNKMMTFYLKQRVFLILTFSSKSQSKKKLNVKNLKKFQNKYFNHHNDHQLINENHFKTTNLLSKFRLKSNPKPKQPQIKQFNKRSF